MTAARLPVSVFIIAKDEADRIPAPIRSVRDWADEVIVIDSGSSDDTVQVAEALGARVVFNPWTGYGPQKVFGESLCRNEWLLNIDADEEITPGLRDEIARELTADCPYAAFRLPILPLYPFQRSGHPWTAFHKPVRLYRRTQAGFKADLVHDSVVVREGRVHILKGMVNHRSFRSLAHHLDKVNFYSGLQAEDRAAKGKDPSGMALLLTPIFAFFKSYVLRREFVNGVDGIVISYMYAFQRFIRLAKTRERLRRPGGDGDA